MPVKKKKKKKKGKVDVVTGACGFSGSYLVKHLLEKGRKVRATDLQRTHDSPAAAELRRTLDLDYERDGVEWVASDLTRKETLTALFEKGDVGCLFHPASVYDYAAPWDLLKKVNIDGVTNLLEAALAGGIDRMVHWSTCGVFGHANFPGSYLEGRPHLMITEFFWNTVIRPWGDAAFKRPRRRPTNQPMTEDQSNPKNTAGDTPEGTHFCNEYGRSKWIQEKIVWKYHRDKGLPVTVIRPAPIYGPGSDYGVTGMFIALSEGLLPIYPAGSSFLLFGGNVHARDVARAVLYLAERDDTIGEDYNVADGCLITHREAFEAVIRLLGRKIYFIPFPLGLWEKGVKALSASAQWLEKKFPSTYSRSRMLDPGQLNYLTMGVWISNKKLRDLGFKFEYPDSRKGMADTVAWLIETGKIK